MSKKVLYLFGAGATEAVVRHLGSPKGLLPRAVQDEIGTYSSRGIDPEVWDELTSDDSDVEHLVSVLDCQFNYSTSEAIRKLYQLAISTLSRPYSLNPPRDNLYSVLLDYHLGLQENATDESLVGIITLNYEDILERTIAEHFRDYRVDYSLHSSTSNSTHQAIKIYKLHGSFNWINKTPIEVRDMARVDLGKALWIPPGVDKRKDNYPFNLLWGKVMEELIGCDVLRVVGCSLSRNDWGLIPILYTIQRFTKRDNPIRIEIVDFPRVAQAIKNNYAYLSRNVFSLMDMTELRKYFKRNFPKASPKRLEKELDQLKSPFQEWLEAKAEFVLSTKHLPIDTDRQILRTFYYKEI